MKIILNTFFTIILVLILWMDINSAIATHYLNKSEFYLQKMVCAHENHWGDSLHIYGRKYNTAIDQYRAVTNQAGFFLNPLPDQSLDDTLFWKKYKNIQCQ